MPARLWLLVIGVLSLTALPASAWATWRAAGAELGAEHAQPTVSTDATPRSSDLRLSECVELSAAAGRVVCTRVLAPKGFEPGTGCAPATARAAGWCDVAQCRRWAGTHLLRYAKPPPARA